MNLTSFHYFEHSVTVSLSLHVRVLQAVQERIAMEVMEAGMVMWEAWAWE